MKTETILYGSIVNPTNYHHIVTTAEQLRRLVERNNPTTLERYSPTGADNEYLVRIYNADEAQHSLNFDFIRYPVVVCQEYKNFDAAHVFKVYEKHLVPMVIKAYQAAINDMTEALTDLIEDNKAAQ